MLAMLLPVTSMAKDPNNSKKVNEKYEELVKDPESHQKKIYEFLNINSDFDEKKRKSFFSQTASIRQIGSDIHKKSIKKEEFMSHKDEFFESILMQRKYWEKRGIISQNNDFFGYKLNK